MGRHEAPDEPPTKVVTGPPPPRRLPVRIQVAGAAAAIATVGVIAWLVAPDGDPAGIGIELPTAIAAEPTARGGPLGALATTTATSTLWDAGPGDGASQTRACRCAPRQPRATAGTTEPTTTTSPSPTSSTTTTTSTSSSRSSTTTTTTTTTSSSSSPTPPACELDPLFDCDGNPRDPLPTDPSVTNPVTTTSEAMP